MGMRIPGPGRGPRGRLNSRGNSPGGGIMAAFRDMEEVSQGLLSLLGANRAEAQLKQLLGRHERMVGRLLETQDEAEQRLQGEKPPKPRPREPPDRGPAPWSPLILAPPPGVSCPWPRPLGTLAPPLEDPDPGPSP